MEITVNGERREVGAAESVAGLIESIGLPRGAVIVERNGSIVDRSEFETTLLSPGDVIELVRMVGGG